MARRTSRNQRHTAQALKRWKKPYDLTDDLQRQVRESLERYELVAKATNDAIYDLDIQRAYITWNEALYTHYGYVPEEPAHTIEWWAQHIHPDDAFRIENEISALLLTTENTWYSEYRFRKADGSYAYVRDRAFVLRDEEGMPQRIIGSLLDVTEQKQLDRAKDEFISLISHELRTPLTVIRLYSEILENGMAGDLNAKQYEYAKHISHASVRLIKLVSDILSISRIELERLAVDPLPTNVNEFIAGYIQELAPLARQRGVTITFRPEPDLPLVPLDATVFGQTLYNLLTNAIRYTAAGKGRVRVRFTKESDSYQLQVSDNGIGIPKAAQPHVFSRFYRAKNAVDVTTEGTGLGLYLVKLLSEVYGGKVWFESVARKGTTFFVAIPLHGMQRSSGTWSALPAG